MCLLTLSVFASAQVYNLFVPARCQDWLLVSCVHICFRSSFAQVCCLLLNYDLVEPTCLLPFSFSGVRVLILMWLDFPVCIFPWNRSDCTSTFTGRLIPFF